MKQGHFIALYFIIYLYCFVLLFIEQEKYDQVIEEKERIESALKIAVEETAWELTSVIKEPIQKKKKIIESAFFEYLYISLGLLQEIEEQKKLNMYLPMLVLIEEEGAFFYYMKEVEENMIVRMWSEPILFSFPEGSTDSKKKSIIVETIEPIASQIISNHNYIAEQYGINYSFYVPKFLENTSDELHFPMLFAVFQGWPLTPFSGILYENCVDAAVYIQEVEKYIVELPKSVLQSYTYYHKLDCNYIGAYSGKTLSQTVSKKQAIYLYGAYACKYCIKKK